MNTNKERERKITKDREGARSCIYIYIKRERKIKSDKGIKRHVRKEKKEKEGKINMKGVSEKY